MNVENTKRFMKGKLSVIRKQCKKCGHHKAFNKNDKIIECTRCRNVF